MDICPVELARRTAVADQAYADVCRVILDRLPPGSLPDEPSLGAAERRVLATFRIAELSLSELFADAAAGAVWIPSQASR